jgi:hypothetical protein
LHFAAATNTKLEKAISEVSAIEPSLPDDFEGGKSATNYHFGNGPLNSVSDWGTQTNYTSSGSGFLFHGGSPTINSGTDSSTPKG